MQFNFVKSSQHAVEENTHFQLMRNILLQIFLFQPKWVLLHIPIALLKMEIVLLRSAFFVIISWNIFKEDPFSPCDFREGKSHHHGAVRLYAHSFS